jgi:hypothetical protein
MFESLPEDTVAAVVIAAVIELVAIGCGDCMGCGLPGWPRSMGMLLYRTSRR